MSAKIIDGNAIAQAARNRVQSKIEEYRELGNRIPCLAVVLVGADPASQVYVRHKEKACEKTGIQSITVRLDASVTSSDLEAKIKELNNDPKVDGILLQLPLPSHLEALKIIAHISPEKDVDGLTPHNQGILAWREPMLLPCTPQGILALIQSTGIELSGKLAAVVGRSVLVGSPTAQVLLNAGATVIVMHEKTQNIEKLASGADVLVVATGVKGLVGADWIKPGAVVIDVGIHRESTGLTGDVRYEESREVAGHITPVPGGVGPMTIAMLIANLLVAYENHLSLS